MQVYRTTHPAQQLSLTSSRLFTVSLQYRYKEHICKKYMPTVPRIFVGDVGKGEYYAVTNTDMKL
jgi:hypothetical protein